MKKYNQILTTTTAVENIHIFTKLWNHGDLLYLMKKNIIKKHWFHNTFSNIILPWIFLYIHAYMESYIGYDWVMVLIPIKNLADIFYILDPLHIKSNNQRKKLITESRHQTKIYNKRDVILGNIQFSHRFYRQPKICPQK